MQLVRAAALTGYFEVAEEFGLNTMSLLRRAGLTRSMLRNPEQPIPALAAFTLLESSAEQSDCSTFGLRMVEHRRLGDVGLLSILFAHQPTLGAALEILSTYRLRLNPTLVYLQQQLDRTILLTARFVFGSPAVHRQAGDIAIAVLHQACRTVFASNWRPLQISFPYAAPEESEMQVYARIFACPAAFDADPWGISIDATELNAVNPNSDPVMALHARRLVESLIDPEERGVVGEIEATLIMLMPQQRASVTAVADALGVNVRTLQRRLHAEGTQFSELLDRLRRSLVAEHLGDSRLSMADVALALGFSSAASFSRWHREQFCEAPSTARNLIKQTR